MNTTALHTQIVEITPKKAAALLKKNTGNRNVSERLVSRLKLSIERDEWVLNGEAIKIATNGTILDGQHRLHACVEAGKPFTTLLITGLPVEAQDTMDTGKSRNLGDILKIRKERSVHELAAIITAIIRAEKWGLQTPFRNGGGSAYALTNRECLERLQAEPTLREVAQLGTRYRRAGLTGRMAGTLYYFLSKISPDDAHFFFERLLSGADLPADSSILVLRRWLQTNSVEAKSTAWRNQYYVAAITIKAWNKFREGLPVKGLSFRAGGANPEPFPQPK